MNSIQLAIERERRNADLWKVYRPQEAARSEARILELQAELGKALRDELKILARFEAQAEPIPKPPILNPLGIDEYVDGQWIRDDAGNSKRPR